MAAAAAVCVSTTIGVQSLANNCGRQASWGRTNLRHDLVICCDDGRNRVLEKVAELKSVGVIGRRDVVGGSSLGLFSVLFARPAFGLLEADDDELLLEKVKEDRAKRIQKRGNVTSFKKETASFQTAVYQLSRAGQALDSEDFSTATAVLGSTLDVDWIKDMKAAFSRVSSNAEEESEARKFTSALASLQSAVSRKDVDTSRSEFVASASAIEKWSTLTGFADEVKGIWGVSDRTHDSSSAQ